MGRLDDGVLTASVAAWPSGGPRRPARPPALAQLGLTRPPPRVQVGLAAETRAVARAVPDLAAPLVTAACERRTAREVASR